MLSCATNLLEAAGVTWLVRPVLARNLYRCSTKASRSERVFLRPDSEIRFSYSSLVRVSNFPTTMKISKVAHLSISSSDFRARMWLLKSSTNSLNSSADSLRIVLKANNAPVWWETRWCPRSACVTIPRPRRNCYRTRGAF